MKLFADRHDFEHIIFFDASDYVELRTHTRLIEANFENENGVLSISSLPDHYLKYHINISVNVYVTDVELNDMCQWRNAIELSINDHCDIAYRLSQRSEGFKGMVSLERLYFRMDHKKFQFKLFEQTLPSLKSVRLLRISHDKWTRTEWLQFIRSQSKPHGNWLVSFDKRYIYFNKLITDGNYQYVHANIQ